MKKIRKNSFIANKLNQLNLFNYPNARLSNLKGLYILLVTLMFAAFLGCTKSVEEKLSTSGMVKKIGVSYDNFIDETLANSFIDNYLSGLSSCHGTSAQKINLNALREVLSNSIYSDQDAFVMHYTTNSSGDIHIIFALYDGLTNTLKSEYMDITENGLQPVSPEEMTNYKNAFIEKSTTCSSGSFAKYAFYTVGDMRNYMAYIDHHTSNANFLDFKFSQISYSEISALPEGNQKTKLLNFYTSNHDNFILPICYVLDATKNRIADVQAKDCASLCPVHCNFY